MPRPKIDQSADSAPDPNTTTNSARRLNMQLVRLHAVYSGIAMRLAVQGVLSYGQAAQILEEIWHEWPTECRPLFEKTIEIFWDLEDLCSRHRNP